MQLRVLQYADTFFVFSFLCFASTLITGLMHPLGGHALLPSRLAWLDDNLH